MTAPVVQLLRNGLVLDAEKETITPVDILIEGDTIRQLGPRGMPAPPGAVTLEAAGRLILPGLVNAHTHGHGSLGKGCGDRWSLELLLNASPWLNGSYGLEEKYLSAQLNAAEMVLKGCTAAYDLYFEPPTATSDGLAAVGQGYADVGVRVVLAPMMADLSLYQAIPGLLDALPVAHRRAAEAIRAAPHERHIEVCRAVLHDWPHDRDSVRPALGPTIPLHCSDAFIRACAALAREFAVGVQMHLGESKLQAVSGLERYGQTLTRQLDALGLLGPGFTGAHGVWLDDDDLKLMRDRGAGIAHNPGSNLRLGSGVAPARRMLELGIPTGIGSDGSASSDNQNMFEAMRLAAFVSRIADPQPERWLGSWEVLRAATIGGAQVLGMDGLIGRLAPGYKADLVLLDLGNVNFVPLNDAANQIVNCEDSSAVHSVMIGGRMVLEDRRFTGLDFERLARDAQAAADRLTQRNAPARAQQEAMAAFVLRHCVGLAGRHYHIRRRLDGA